MKQVENLPFNVLLCLTFRVWRACQQRWSALQLLNELPKRYILDFSTRFICDQQLSKINHFRRLLLLFVKIYFFFAFSCQVLDKSAFGDAKIYEALNAHGNKKALKRYTIFILQQSVSQSVGRSVSQSVTQSVNQSNS